MNWEDFIQEVKLSKPLPQVEAYRQGNDSVVIDRFGRLRLKTDNFLHPPSVRTSDVRPSPLSRQRLHPVQVHEDTPLKLKFATASQQVAMQFAAPLIQQEVSLQNASIISCAPLVCMCGPTDIVTSLSSLLTSKTVETHSISDAPCDSVMKLYCDTPLDSDASLRSPDSCIKPSSSPCVRPGYKTIHVRLFRSPRLNIDRRRRKTYPISRVEQVHISVERRGVEVFLNPISPADSRLIDSLCDSGQDYPVVHAGNIHKVARALRWYAWEVGLERNQILSLKAQAYKRLVERPPRRPPEERCSNCGDPMQPPLAWYGS